jgi:hypothetical protein
MPRRKDRELPTPATDADPIMLLELALNFEPVDWKRWNAERVSWFRRHGIDPANGETVHAVAKASRQAHGVDRRLTRAWALSVGPQEWQAVTKRRANKICPS